MQNVDHTPYNRCHCEHMTTTSPLQNSLAVFTYPPLHTGSTQA